MADQKRTSSERSSAEFNIVSVAIEINESQELKKLNLSDSLDEILETLCKCHNIFYEPGKYTLQWSNNSTAGLRRSIGTVYVTEDNKYQIKNGSELKLVFSPKRDVGEFKEGLKTKDCVYYLKKVANCSKDKQFMFEFQEQNVLQIVLKIAGEKNELVSEENLYAITFVKNALLLGFICSVPKEIFQKLVNIINAETATPALILVALKCLLQIVIKNLLNCNTDEKIRLIERITVFLRKENRRDIQGKALTVINNIVLYSGNTKEHQLLLNYVANGKLKEIIGTNILNEGNLNLSIKHELYVYQTIVMGIYWDKLHKTINDRHEKFQRLKRISNDYHCHEIENENINDLSRSNSSLSELSNNEKRKTFKENLDQAWKNVYTSFKRSKSRSRSESEISESKLSVSSATEERRGSTLSRSTSIKEKLASLISSKEDQSVEIATPIEPEIRDDEWEYAKEVNFKFYGDIDKQTYKGLEKYVYDTPKAPIRSKRKSRQSKETEKVSGKPPIAKKPSDIHTKIENFRSQKSLDKEEDKEIFIPVEENIKEETGVNGEVQLRDSEQISFLTLQNITYLAVKERRQFKRCCLIEKGNGHSFYNLSDELTKIICEILEVGKRPQRDIHMGAYLPIAFFNENFVEELFCEAVLLFRRTWNEMRGKILEDYPKVLDVVKQQLQKGLHGQPANFEQFKSFLKAASYATIAEIRKNETEQRMKKDLEQKPVFKHLREILYPTALESIKQNRINFMKEGTKFTKYLLKEKKVEEKKTKFFIKLSQNKDSIIYGKWDEKSLKFKDEMRSSVKDIKQIVTGKKCQHYKLVNQMLNLERDMFFRGGRNKEHEIDYPISIILDDSDNTSLDMFAPSQEIQDCWVDGINILLGNEMMSEQFEAELKEYLDLAIRLQILEVEGLYIPDSPPIIPPPPKDFKFALP